MGRLAVCDQAAAFADRRGGMARQLRAVQIRFADLLAGRCDRLRPSGSLDLHRADLAVGDRRHRQHRFRDFPGALDGGGKHLPSALVSHEHHVGIHGADLRRLRCETAGLHARRHQPAQHDVAARSRPRSVRSRQQFRIEAGQADRHHGLHVRDAVSAAHHHACGEIARRCRTTMPIAGRGWRSGSIRTSREAFGALLFHASFRDGPKDQTSDAQLRIEESGFRVHRCAMPRNDGK